MRERERERERDRSRSVTPPPAQTPSSTYLALAEQSPSPLEDPASLRKLLVLDLNGTLLHRSGAHLHHQPRAYDPHGRPLPRLRPVHPRPYMGAFRAFLFHPGTMSWLDVMVWSSAQPHSVDDMVDKCFGDSRRRMIAVWARDTLGLSADHYHRKVQTTKDLAKPWTLLAPKTAKDPSASPSTSIASTPPSSPVRCTLPPPPAPSTDVSPQAHSALTTLLLDDSPRKAELQPYNHVCIGEYSGSLRSKDVENLQKEQEWSAAVAAREELDAFKAHAQAQDSSAQPVTASAETSSPAKAEGAAEVEADSPATAESSQKRKRKEKKLRKRADRLYGYAQGKPIVSYDETLLAVIGVLDAIKHQANVAAWIRAGGLWGTRPPVSSASTTASSSAAMDGSSSLTKEEKATDEEDDAGARSDDSTLSVEKTAGKKRQRRRGPSAEVEAKATGDDALEEEIANGEEKTKMWFDDADVVAHWARRGRKALEALEIPVEHGIER
ncbi:uncharacterized protein BXZ73DRAFT_43390 [Epithele typhae]|uniref:uncharacterized protein n=1 Tax=Epithele typhae TaxID=378194 RepID=UPI002007E854|nr:uncharacterized protein BXZ73DRAFT_43390 [Epithele typhae]KAH9939622.1 hypothetical protein BXZ73DRAFT_43390 [Epithele typhae]